MSPSANNISLDSTINGTTTLATKYIISPLQSLWEIKERLQDVAKYFTTSKTFTNPSQIENQSTLPTLSTFTSISVANSSELSERHLLDNRTFRINDNQGISWTTEMRNVYPTQEHINIDESFTTEYHISTTNSPDNYKGNLTQCHQTICEELPFDLHNLLSNYIQNTKTTNNMLNVVTTISPLQIEQHYQNNITRLKRVFKEIERNLTSMCWETSLGQELSKVIVFDGVSYLYTYTYPYIFSIVLFQYVQGLYSYYILIMVCLLSL